MPVNDSPCLIPHWQPYCHQAGTVYQSTELCDGHFLNSLEPLLVDSKHLKQQMHDDIIWWKHYPHCSTLVNGMSVHNVTWCYQAIITIFTVTYVCHKALFHNILFIIFTHKINLKVENVSHLWSRIVHMEKGKYQSNIRTANWRAWPEAREAELMEFPGNYRWQGESAIFMYWVS